MAPNLINAVVDKLKERQMVIKATSDDAEPTPGYLFNELSKLTYNPDSLRNVEDYLDGRLEKKSSNVRLKALKIIKYLCDRGNPNFRRDFQRRTNNLRQCLHFKGPMDAQMGDLPNQMVRDTAQEVMNIVFDTERDDAQRAPERRMAGFGGGGDAGAVAPPSTYSMPDRPEFGSGMGSFGGGGSGMGMQQRGGAAKSRAEASVYGDSDGAYSASSSGFQAGVKSFSTTGGDSSSGGMSFDPAKPAGLGNSRPQFVGFGNSSFAQPDKPKETNKFKQGLEKMKQGIITAAGKVQQGVKKLDEQRRQAKMQNQGLYSNYTASGGGFGVSIAGESKPAHTGYKAPEQNLFASSPTLQSAGVVDDVDEVKEAVRDVTAGTGARPAPTREALASFCTRIHGEDISAVCAALNDKLVIPQWHVKLRALHAVEAVAKMDAAKVSAYFNSNPRLLVEQVGAVQATLREKAQKLVKTLQVDTSAVAASTGTAAASRPAAAASASAETTPDLLFGGMTVSAPATSTPAPAPAASSAAAASKPAVKDMSSLFGGMELRQDSKPAPSASGVSGSSTSGGATGFSFMTEEATPAAAPTPSLFGSAQPTPTPATTTSSAAGAGQSLEDLLLSDLPQTGGGGGSGAFDFMGGRSGDAFDFVNDAMRKK